MTVRAKKRRLIRLSTRVRYEKDRHGNVRVVSARRRLKKQLMREHGITTGRQWKKLQRRLREEGRHTNA